jgi:hypothetical protein
MWITCSLKGGYRGGSQRTQMRSSGEIEPSCGEKVKVKVNEMLWGNFLIS